MQRGDCIIAFLGPFKAMILHDHALFFSYERRVVQSALSRLQRQLTLRSRQIQAKTLNLSTLPTEDDDEEPEIDLVNFVFHCFALFTLFIFLLSIFAFLQFPPTVIMFSTDVNAFWVIAYWKHPGWNLSLLSSNYYARKYLYIHIKNLKKKVIVVLLRSSHVQSFVQASHAALPARCLSPSRRLDARFLFFFIFFFQH